jgi:putative ABC transport system permease protein
MGYTPKPYRFFLKFYSARFREEYESALEQQFMDEYREMRGAWNHFCFWMRALTDLAISIPVEFVHELKQDLGFALRAYCRRPLLTVLALSSLALAIGAATGVFSVVNAVLLRSLPFRDAGRLVRLENIFFNNSHASLQDWLKNNGACEDVALYAPGEANLSLTQGSMRVKIAETTANFFSLLGSEPQFGRSFTEGEDTAGHDSVAVIGHGLWRQLFDGDPRVIGETIRLNGIPMTVIGVAPREFDFPGKISLWTPTAFHRDLLLREGGALLPQRMVGRLKKNTTPVQAASILEAAEARHRAGQPHAPQNSVRVVSIRDVLAGPVRKASLVLMCAVLFVLMIACANVAHLLLFRTTERRQELALRASLGASCARLVQQLITESTLLTLTASVAGLALAYWAAKLASTVIPPQLSTQHYTILDWRVLGFAVATALFTGLIFGVMPVRLISRMQPSGDSLRAQTASAGHAMHRMRNGLIAMQSALAVVLLAGAAVMGGSFLKLMNTDLGFHTGSIVTLNVSLAGTPNEPEMQRRQYFSEALRRLRGIPGVQAAGAASYLPLASNALMVTPCKMETGSKIFAIMNSTTPDFFRAMNAAVVAGREFTASDISVDASSIIVDTAFARQVGEAPNALIGKKLNLNLPGFSEWRTIVGVVGAMRHFGPAENEPSPEIFWPAEQKYAPIKAMFVVRVRGDARSFLPICRTTLQTLDRRAPVYDVMPFDARLRELLSKPRFYTIAVLFFSGFALLLAIAGSYGVASYSVSMRMREIGVRRAVGASRPLLRWMLLRQNMIPVIVGVAVGVAGAFGLSRFLQHLMETAEPVNALACGLAVLILVAAAITAVWTASSRILRMDPMTILRAE